MPAKKKSPKKKEANLDAALDGEVEIAGLTLRPFSFGSLILCQKLGLTLFTEEPSDEDALNQGDELLQISTFLWMQSTDPREVRKAVRDGSYETRVDTFADKLEVHNLGNYMAEINRISSLAGKAAVDVIPKGDEGDKDAPGN